MQPWLSLRSTALLVLLLPGPSSLALALQLALQPSPPLLQAGRSPCQPLPGLLVCAQWLLRALVAAAPAVLLSQRV